MTPEELTELDRKVAEALGFKERNGYWHDDRDYEVGLVSNRHSHDPVLDSEVRENREVFMPSSDWNDAMFAAQKAALFEDAMVYLAKGMNWKIEAVDRYGYAGNIEIAEGETGPIAICNAILALKGE